MRIAITGATGFVGRALVNALVERGDEVVAISRSPERARSLLPLIAAHHAHDDLHRAFDGADAIVHLAGESVVGRWSNEKRRAIRDSRVEGTRAIVDALADLDRRPQALISASAIGFYGDRGDEDCTEDSGPGADFLATTSVEWESEAARATDYGLRVASMRIGIVLGTGGGALEAMLLPFKLGAGGPLGSGRQWWSWIHIRDLVRMLVTAVDESWTGSYNATAPYPERQKDFARILGRALSRPAILPAPGFALRAILGEFSTELLNGKRVIPERAQKAGFRFEFEHLDDALADLIG
jgi:uncharacterized protein (TIGR01777 family)